MAAERVYSIPAHILDDLCSRFVLNVPDEYRRDVIRTLFNIELAHWFYIDFFVPETPELRAVGLKEFTHQVFKHCPFLLAGDVNIEAETQSWKNYKFSIPTYGGILLDERLDHVLLVQAHSKTWGFPKGKINEKEVPVKCAIRELMEEIGFDATGMIDDEDYVDHTVGDQYSGLFIIPGVPMDTHFKAKHKYEIRDISWFPLQSLPTHKRDSNHLKELGYGPNSFFMVIPYIKKLKQWVQNKKAVQLKEKRHLSEAQRAFAQKNLQEFEEILNADIDSPGGHSKLSPRRPGKKPYRASNQSPQTYYGGSSPSYTILSSKKEENLKKLSEIRRSLDHHHNDSKGDDSQDVFTTCKSWSNVRLDVNAIMKSIFKT